MTGDGDAQGAAGLGGVQPVTTARDGQGYAGAAMGQAGVLADVSLPLPGPAGESASVRGAGRVALVLPAPIHRSTSNVETDVKGAK